MKWVCPVKVSLRIHREHAPPRLATFSSEVSPGNWFPSSRVHASPRPRAYRDLSHHDRTSKHRLIALRLMGTLLWRATAKGGLKSPNGRAEDARREKSWTEWACGVLTTWWQLPKHRPDVDIHVLELSGDLTGDCRGLIRGGQPGGFRGVSGCAEGERWHHVVGRLLVPPSQRRPRLARHSPRPTLRRGVGQLR